MNNTNNHSDSTMFARYREEFANVISQYPILEPYLTLDCNSSSDDNQRTAKKVQEYYQKNCLDKEPHLRLYSEDIIYFYSSNNLNIHMVYYLSFEIWNQASRIYQKNVSFLSSIIFFSLFFYDKFKVNKVKIDYNKLIDTLSRINSNKVKAIKYKIHTIKSKVHLAADFNPNNRKIFIKLTDFFSTCRTFYIGIHCYQHIFEASISSDNFIYSKEIKALIDNFCHCDPSIANNSIYSIAKTISDHFHVSKRKGINIVYILLLRFIYDQNYCFICSKYFQNKNIYVIKKSFESSFLRSLKIPELYLPIKFVANGPFREILLNDHNYRHAIWFIEDINYVTNPFDILANIKKSLNEIQEAARRLSKQSNLVLTFQDKVILLFLVILSSQIPELYDFMNLVNDYSFDHQLYPELDELKAIFITSVGHINSMNLSDA